MYALWSLAKVGWEQLEIERGRQLSLCVHVTHHVVQFSRPGGSLGFTLRETRLGEGSKL
jgi:hypothetical protein